MIHRSHCQSIRCGTLAGIWPELQGMAAMQFVPAVPLVDSARDGVNTPWHQGEQSAV